MLINTMQHKQPLSPNQYHLGKSKWAEELPHLAPRQKRQVSTQSRSQPARHKRKTKLKNWGLINSMNFGF